MKRIIVLALIGAGAICGQTTVVLGDQFTVSNTPTQFSTTMTPVQSIRFQVIPGYCGKIYIGLQGMSATTYAKLLSVLWPNCTGGHSESFTLSDLSGNNGIDPTTIYIAGGNAGDQITWSAVKYGGSSSNADGETPSGTVNGTNTTFTLSHSPNPSASLILVRNGLVMSLNTDFTLNANTITFLTASIPQTGDTLVAWYRY
jgi:hypothetical protein